MRLRVHARALNVPISARQIKIFTLKTINLLSPKLTKRQVRNPYFDTRLHLHLHPCQRIMQEAGTSPPLPAPRRGEAVCWPLAADTRAPGGVSAGPRGLRGAGPGPGRAPDAGRGTAAEDRGLRAGRRRSPGEPRRPPHPLTPRPRHSPKSRNCLMERGEGEKRE